MAEALIVDATMKHLPDPDLIVTVDSDKDGNPQPTSGSFTDLLLPVPANLDAEQRTFWRWFPSRVTPLGELRRKIGLTRREWYHPLDNARYHKLANLSDHLKKEPARVKQLLEDDAALLAYIATLRLQGA